MVSEAVILAGGLGTRLQGVIDQVPKAMAPVNGKPFLSYLLDYLLHSKINRVVLSIGYLGKLIRDFYGTSYKSLNIDYAVENEPLGTGGGMRLAFQKVNTERAIVLNGDTYIPLNIGELCKAHLERNASVTIALKQVEDVSRYGSVLTDASGRIQRFAEKNTGSAKGFINAGVYLIEKDFFKRNSFAEKFSFERDALEKLCHSEAMFGFGAGSYFIDIGIPDDYRRAQQEFKQMGL